jgi:hypothetical protein
MYISNGTQYATFRARIKKEESESNLGTKLVRMEANYLRRLASDPVNCKETGSVPTDSEREKATRATKRKEDGGHGPRRREQTKKDTNK